MIERISLEEWRAFDALHPAPTFFARPFWPMALARCFAHFEPAALRVRNQLGSTIVPTTRVHGGALGWKEYRGSPMGGYTCFLREDGSLASQEECNRAACAIGKEADAATLIPWPLGPVPTCGEGAVHETAVIDLSHGIEAVLEGLAGISRRMAGQALRRGVICERSAGGDAVERYFSLLELSAKRWGLAAPPISKQLLEALVEIGRENVEIWFATVEGRDIAGGVVLYGSEELFFWSAAMDAAYGRLRPSNALNVALMRHAAQRGMKWYNLGASEGLPGVARFKQDLGARELPYHDLRSARTPYRLYTHVRRALVRVGA